MAQIESIKDYYNRFNPDKEYARNLYLSGKVLQSAEMNEMESILLERIRNVADTVLTNGDIIEGCQLVIGEGGATVTRGKVYLDGNVRTVHPTTVDLTFRGQERIGVKLVSEVVTAADDPDLLDPATGYDNYGADGAYRLKEYVVVTVNDDAANTVYILNDGIQEKTVSLTEDASQLNKLNTILAKRTFDESGNYKVSGFEIIDKEMCDDDNIYVGIEPGKAYVRGYEVIKSSPVTIPVKRPDTFRTAMNEPKVYRSGNNQYALNNHFVNRLNRVVSIVEVSKTMTRGGIAGGIDYLPAYPVTEIVSVTQSGITYELDEDFRLTGDGIDWSPSGNEPEPGMSYDVVWRYNKTMLKGKDYEFVRDDDDPDRKGYVRFMEDGDKPCEGSTFLCDYDYLLSRVDTFSIDKDGTIITTPGQPDILAHVGAPAVSDDAVLVLGSVLVMPLRDDTVITNNNTKNIPMSDLYKMLTRINEIEYNQAVSDLDVEAASGEQASELQGVYTDGFIGLTKADVFHKEFNAAINVVDETMSVQAIPTIKGLNIDDTLKPTIGKFGRLITAPYGIRKVLSQMYASNVVRVNAYNAFPKTPTLALAPASDNWIDYNTLTVQGQTMYRNGGATYVGWSSTGNYRTSTTSYSSSSVSQSVQDTAITYMREIRVDVSIANLEPNVDNVQCMFDGKPVAMTGSEPKYNGTMSGTLKADVNGNSSGYFTIPSGTRTGTRQFQAYPESAPALMGTANFTANGTQRTTTNTVVTTITTQTVFTAVVTPVTYDPVAQSFQFATDMYLTGIGIYFHDKNTKEPITVQIRNMVNGYPGNIVYAEKTISGKDCHTSSIAAMETVVMFDDPAYLNANESYCFTVLSNSDIDSLWTAETSGRDIATNEYIAKNPYMTGVMFSSSNAQTWTAHQNADLKFNVYAAQFNGNGEVIFEDVDDVNADAIMLRSSEAIPAGCSVEWQYETNGDGAWLPLLNSELRELTTKAESVRFKAVLKIANEYTSPAIALDSLMTALFANRNSGAYVSRNLHVPDGFNNVKIVADLEIPLATNVKMFFATDVDGTNWETIPNTRTDQKSQSVTTYTFEKTLADSVTDYRVKVEVSTENSLKVPKVRKLRSILKTV